MIQEGLLFAGMVHLKRSFLQHFLLGAKKCIDPVHLMVIFHPQITHPLLCDLDIMSAHSLGSRHHGCDHRVLHHPFNFSRYACPIILRRDAAEMQVLVKQIRIGVVLAMEIEARLHLRICCLGKRQTHRF